MKKTIAYCGNSSKDSFAQLVCYSLLKDEDAQCFSVRSSIGGILLIKSNQKINTDGGKTQRRCKSREADVTFRFPNDDDDEE